MSTLEKLKLVNAVKPQHLPAIVKRRNKLSVKLWEQILLAKSKVNGEALHLTRQRSVKNMDTGVKESITVPKLVRPWWFTAEDGSTCISVKYGNKTLELAKGKSSIQLTGAEDLINTLELIKQAVESGELDQQIDQVSGAVKSNFKKSGDTK
jgi:hypothetical protein